jgi:hypothetical protein
MANYKIALKLYQSQVGDENAEVKISINGTIVADNVEVSNTDSENPTLLVYDAADLPAPSEDTTTVIKVELLNDFYVDSNNDRNAYWVGCGYAVQDDDENYYRRRSDVRQALGDRLINGVPAEILTDWTDVQSFSWAKACEYTGDENGTVDMAEADDGVQLTGWWPFSITATYVSATIPLTNLLVDPTD